MNKEYFIEINGEQIPVTEEVYYAFKRPAWRERKSRQARSGREVSIESFVAEGFEIPSKDKPVDEIVGGRQMLDMLNAAIEELSDDERYLIDAIFYQNKSERKIASELGISQPAVHKRRDRILEMLKKLL